MIETNESTLVDDLFKKRIVLMDKEVNESTCGELIGRLALLDLLGKTKKSPILLLVNSFGGYTSGALGVADVIKSSICPVITVCIGIAQSAGSIILAAGHKRYALANADIMIHQHWQEFPETLTHAEIIEEAKSSTKHHDVLVQFYVKNSNMTKKKVSDLLSKDSYLSAKESLDLGLIDDISWNIHEWLK